MASLNLDLTLRVLTPLHIGGSDDKHLMEGIGYLCRDGMVYVFHPRKMLQAIGDVDQYCNALENGADGINNLLKSRRIPIEAVSMPPKPIVGTASEIKTCIKDGLTGRPYVPGSSIKGAIRSVIFANLFAESGMSVKDAEGIKDEKTGRNVLPDDHLLGKFQSSIMRFIQCADIHFDDVDTIFCNAKIFNLQNQGREGWVGGWKHGSNSTNSNFRAEGFTFAFECIPPGATGRFRLSFDEDLFKKAAKSEIRNVEIGHYVKRMFSRDFEYTLLDAIMQHTHQHIQREVEFFTHTDYEVAQTEAIVGAFEGIATQNEDKAPILRMASGSGFHGITGDWQFPNHIDTGKKQGIPKYKSRRLNFNEDTENEYSFNPMGFVQLCTKAHFEDVVKPLVEKEKSVVAAKLAAVEKARLEKAEQDRIAAEEASKPVMQGIDGLKKGRLIDAEVVGQNGMQLLLKPYVIGFTEQILSVRYPAGMEKGTTIKITAKLEGKRLVLSGAPTKKS